MLSLVQKYLTLLQSEPLSHESEDVLQIYHGDVAVALSVKDSERVTDLVLDVLVMIVLCMKDQDSYSVYDLWLSYYNKELWTLDWLIVTLDSLSKQSWRQYI